MRSGKLDRVIDITRTTTTPNPDEPWEPGTPVTTTVATVRAQVIQQSTEEFMKSFGEAQETAIVFRIRWLDGVLLTDQIAYDGKSFDIVEIKEIGRRRGLDLRAKAVS